MNKRKKLIYLRKFSRKKNSHYVHMINCELSWIEYWVELQAKKPIKGGCVY